MGFSIQHANRRRLWASSDWQDDTGIQIGKHLSLFSFIGHLSDWEIKDVTGIWQVRLPFLGQFFSVLLSLLFCSLVLPWWFNFLTTQDSGGCCIYKYNSNFTECFVFWIHFLRSQHSMFVNGIHLLSVLRLLHG